MAKPLKMQKVNIKMENDKREFRRQKLESCLTPKNIEPQRKQSFFVF
jgi:hypothetical protein